MTKTLKDQFQTKNLRPEHENPMTFITSQWQHDPDRPSFIYILVRLAIFITFFVIWILSMTMLTPGARQKWPIYLTNWGLTLCLLQSCLPCILLIGALADDYMRGKYYWKQTVFRVYPFYWVLNIMATTVAFSITLVYWTLVYSAEGAYWSTMNFMVHGFNTILMFVDFLAVSHPVQILHFCYPVLLAITYVTMTAIFYGLGGTTVNGSPYIYPILKWDEPGTTLAYCLGIFILMVIIHTLTYFMYKLRVKVSPSIHSFIHKKLLICCNNTYV